MAKTDALSILESAETKEKLKELDGNLIEAIQKDALSNRLKNTEYSGDPTSGSVVINRFKNAESANYGTARSAGKGSKLKNSGKVTINLDKDKEIIEEIENKDLKFFAVGGLAERRTANHSKRMAAELDRAFFALAESKAKAVTLATGVVDIDDVVEAAIQQVEETNNDWVDGVDRSDIEVTLSTHAYSKLRKYVDVIDGGVGAEATPLFHGVRVYSNTRQTADVIVMRHGSIAQPVSIDDYAAERIGLSNASAIELFYSYGTAAITPDLIAKIVKLPVATTSTSDSGTSTGGGTTGGTSAGGTSQGQ
mgnify:FL=1